MSVILKRNGHYYSHIHQHNAWEFKEMKIDPDKIFSGWKTRILQNNNR
jgi:hypothetical protein